MALHGFSDEQIKEAAWVAQSVTGASAYMYGTGYPTSRFEKELDQMVEHVKKAPAK